MSPECESGIECKFVVMEAGQVPSLLFVGNLRSNFVGFGHNPDFGAGDPCVASVHQSSVTYWRRSDIRISSLATAFNLAQLLSAVKSPGRDLFHLRRS